MIVSFLRGINIGAKNKLKMSEIVSIYTRLGYFKIATYLNTGNVVFIGTRKRPSHLIEKEIQDMIRHCQNLNIEVIVRTKKELQNIVNNFPFESADNKNLYVTMLKTGSKNHFSEQISSALKDNDLCKITNKEIYFYLPGGYGKSKVNNAFIEKKSNTIATTRNLNTLKKVLEMMS